MPKCINDSKKNYTGEEPSPKGNGYSASAEDAGTIMLGKNDSFWIVKQTKTCKRWTDLKINFSNLPKDCYTPAYFPETKLIDSASESGLENKFGGKRPFFVKGESWPMYDDVPMVFFGQFKDPRTTNNILYRIFLPINNSDYLCNYEINSIELNEENQIIIEKPDYIYDDDEKSFFEPHVITEWTQTNELLPFECLIKKLGLPDCDTVSDNYFDNEFTPSSNVKVGGTPMYCQYYDLSREYNKYKINNFIQLTDCRELPYGWGDAGIAHIFMGTNNKLALEWDCC